MRSCTAGTPEENSTSTNRSLSPPIDSNGAELHRSLDSRTTELRQKGRDGLVEAGTCERLGHDDLARDLGGVFGQGNGIHEGASARSATTTARSSLDYAAERSRSDRT